MSNPSGMARPRVRIPARRYDSEDSPRRGRGGCFPLLGCLLALLLVVPGVLFLLEAPEDLPEPVESISTRGASPDSGTPASARVVPPDSPGPASTRASSLSPGGSASPGVATTPTTTPAPPRPGSTSPVASLGPAPSPELALSLPGPPLASAGVSARLRGLESQARAEGSAASWRQLADAAVAEKAYSLAARAYREEARIYRSIDPEAAVVEEQKALQYDTTLEVYLYRPVRPQDAQGPRARLEPAAGCYLGAFIDRDDSLPQLTFRSQTHGDIPAFNQSLGRRHASFFMYRTYGEPFPAEWVDYVKSQGAIPHIAWEPRRLADVQDDDYLRGFAEAAAAADCPLFVRFAGEMNGDWTPYHGDPEAYKRAFRTVYQAFRRAPRAALIWCPNAVPVDEIDRYYPGDDACDWVGVNFYSVLFLDNDPARSAERLNPVDLLDPVYRRYAAKKPIAVGEYAASHFAQVQGKPRPEFTRLKIDQLYGSLPARYPRVKLISWYDCNNLAHARPGRQLNNYLLTEDDSIRRTYSEATSLPYFLGGPGEESPLTAVPVANGDGVPRRGQLLAWVRTYEDEPSVYFCVDGKVRQASRRPGRCRLDLSGLAPGPHQVEALVYDSSGRFVASRKLRLVAHD